MHFFSKLSDPRNDDRGPGRTHRLHQSQDAFGIAAVLEPFALAPDHLERVVDPSAGIGCELEEVTGLVVGLRNDLPLRHGDGQPDALALPLHGVVFGEVAPEGGDHVIVLTNLAFGHLHHAGREDQSPEVALDAVFDLHVAVPGVKNVARGYRDLAPSVAPPFDPHFDHRADGSVGQNARFAAFEIGDVDHLSLFGVPALERPHAHRPEDAQVVVAVAAGELLVRRIPHRLGQLELRTLLAVGVDGLLVVEIDAVGGVLRLEGRAVVVQFMVHVVLLRGGAADGSQGLVGVLEPHLGMYAFFENALVGVRGVENLEILAAGNVRDEDQFVQFPVQLGGNPVNAAERHDGALRPLGHIADHDRTFGALARDRHTVEAFPGFGIQAANGPEDQQKQENPFHGYSSFSMIRSGRAQLGRAAGGSPPGKAHGAASGSTSASGRPKRFSGAGCAAADTATKAAHHM